MTDKGSKWQNTIIIRTQAKRWWKKIKILKNFPQSELYHYSMCLPKESCIRFILKDKKKNGLLKGSYYELYWGDDKVEHNQLPTGVKRQVVEFGDCSE